MINDDKKNLPPSSNTGVGMTNETGVKLTVDWVEGTSHNLNSDQVISELLKYPKDNFVPTKKGAMGYMKGKKDGNISIWFEGQPGMGVHFSLTGDGCRQYESVLKESENPLFDLLQMIDNDESIKLSRLDLAIDDFDGMFNIKNLIKKVKNGECISKFKTARRMEKMLIDDGSSKGTSLYFGSEKSAIMIRMYEKNYQLEVEDSILNWNRTEIQLRDDKANAALREICSDKEFGEVCFGILSNYIRFVDIPADVRKLVKQGKKKIRKDRYPINKKWSKFIGEVQQLRLTVDPKETTMDDKYIHLMKQASKAFVMLEHVDYMDTEALLNAMREKGYDSLRNEDITIMKKFKLQQEMLKEDDEEFYI